MNYFAIDVNLNCEKSQNKINLLILKLNELYLNGSPKSCLM